MKDEIIIYQTNELQKTSTCKEYLQVQLEGKRRIKRKLIVYNLDIIIPILYLQNNITLTK